MFSCPVSDLRIEVGAGWVGGLSRAMPAAGSLGRNILYFWTGVDGRYLTNKTLD